MAARTRNTVAGDEIFLEKKVSSSWITMGCLETFTFTSSVESFEVNCRAFSGKIPSGKAASWTISAGGFTRIFDNTDEATNISEKECYEDHAAKTISEYRFRTLLDGDPVWTGKAFISQFEKTGDQGGAAKFSLTLEGAEPIVLSANPTV